ncbi:MAG TPA: very short patch repair endonuclease [Pyrinomonadaceae bacterium]|nr:very short patch repair endonuclease [Pyrinomonadaceae bacterium]
MDTLTKEQRRRNMQANRGTGSKIEVILAQALWKQGYRYRKNNRTVFGKPDFTFKKLKIAIFVDGEFWHGKDWTVRKHWLKSNQDFWHKKIERNMERDRVVNRILTENGWKIVRFWETDVKKNLEACLEEIARTFEQRKVLK